MNIIVVVNKNWGIGYKDNLLFNFQKNREFFNDMTTNKVFVLGRKTLENTFMSNAPKNRINICLTSNKNYSSPGAVVVNTLNDLFEKLCFYNSDNIYVIGGEQTYKQLLPYCKTCYVAKVDSSIESDAYFENLDASTNWRLITNTDPYYEDNTIFYYCKYENKNPLKFNFGYEKDDLF